MPHYKEISSSQNNLVKHLVKLRLNRDYRYDQKRVIVEGLKTIDELKLPIQRLFTLDPSLISSQIKSEEYFLVTPSVMEKISGLKQSEGLLAEVTMPENADLSNCDYLLILDGINDPGNLGTLIRTALALGWQGVYLMENSCDPYNDKALRSSKGATFRLPLFQGNWETFLKYNQVWNLQLLGADLQGMTPSEVLSVKKRALILGNEAQGLSEQAKKISTLVTIPMEDRMESLNVSIAGGILMYLLRFKG